MCIAKEIYELNTQLEYYVLSESATYLNTNMRKEKEKSLREYKIKTTQTKVIADILMI